MKLLWDFNIQTDRTIKCQQRDTIVSEKFGKEERAIIF